MESFYLPHGQVSLQEYKKIERFITKFPLDFMVTVISFYFKTKFNFIS